MKSIFSVFLVTFVTICANSQDLPTMSCQFTEFIGVSYENPELSQKTEVHQTMRTVLGKTDNETLKLDGSRRATNSTQWKNITLKNWETWQSTFVGDFGEMLTISHELGENKKVLHGWYKCTLVSAGRDSTSILLGRCFIE